jgi:hypothetical protein
MQFSDYQDFRLACQKLIEGEDEDQATFSTAVLDTLIGLGEERVYNGDEVVPGLRASTMVTALAITPSSGVYSLPADLLELKELYFDAARPIEIVSRERLRRMGALSSNGSGLYAAQNGEFPSISPGIALRLRPPTRTRPCACTAAALCGFVPANGKARAMDSGSSAG